MSKLETNQVDPATGTTLTLGTSGDTIAIPSGVTMANSGTATGFGITEADQWRITANHSGVADITANWERVDTDGFNHIGTGMSESSGIFTFPSTGLYQVRFTGYAQCAADDNVIGYIKGTADNSSYDNLAVWVISGDSSTYGAANGVTECFFNVTNTGTPPAKMTSE